METSQKNAQSNNTSEPHKDCSLTATECPEKKPSLLTKLQGLAVNKQVDQMRQYARNAVYIAGRLALAGQITVFYAAPNTGKTLITLQLVSEAIANGTAGDNVYHINLDDTYDGLIEKGDLGNRYGFHVLGPEVFSNPIENFKEVVETLLAEGTANQAVFLLDTVKKFVDVMDKKASSQFMTICRRLTTAGGTIIALAHVNKRQNHDGEGIPAGTSDILDDCDCAYVLNVLGDENAPEGKRRTVEFQQKKARGPVVQEAVYSYEVIHHDYYQMFLSVKLEEGNEVDRVRCKTAIANEKANDLEMIKVITGVLNNAKPTSQKDIVTALTSSKGISRRKLVDCLKRWNCSPDEGGLWEMTKGDSNSNCYQLLV